MTTLLSGRNLSKSYAADTLFEGVALRIVEGDRLGLIGPNGAGKSTLVKILAGLIGPDAGEVSCRRGLRRVYVPQDDRFADGATPLGTVVEGRVVEESGAAVVGARVSVHLEGGALVGSGSSHADGAFSLLGVPAGFGSLEVRAEHDGREAVLGRIEPLPRATTQVGSIHIE